ncbi:thiamine pyrophosphate-binding protein [Qiania dongpingensis]|uniref:Thiamine pyrophosphate-binding protein n=1 Tax=Qiania dongpingensis TaxID=2763669 RepID=A0A7G9G7S2_9FIRM|nr:thiamine pyrophosphate-binding protein [Qiania dongpingensis]QNM06854.1 thiamine pyrophosphate-binding protein [Qiania dongpingensis]
MKVSDYIAGFLREKGVDTVFGYQGSSISHTIDSISRQPNIHYIQTIHEQGAAFAANGYALAKKRFGVAVACSGPGAINLITGIANAYYDSIPCMFIVGQVSTPEIRKNKSMRQLGFQETDITEMVEPITKYAATVMEPLQIAYHLEKAYFEMLDGRKGPVLLNVPHNIQTGMIEEDTVRHFTALQKKIEGDFEKISESWKIISKSKRPLILLGGGAEGINEVKEFIEFCSESKIPVVSSYRGKDVLDNTFDNYVGTIGAYGNRCANLAVKYCDVLLVLGSRIDGRQTGGDFKRFAPNASVICVDIDEIELTEKPEEYCKVLCEAHEYVRKIYSFFSKEGMRTGWLLNIKEWEQRYKIEEEYEINEFVNPNKLIYELTISLDNAVISTDVGQNQIWTNASSIIKKNCLLIQSAGLGSMGYALPASIGAYFANQNRQIICICGDGGFQMNIQELQTIVTNKIPVKIFLMNNKSLGLIRIYQDKALGANYEGSVRGFESPDYNMIAQAYGMRYIKISDNEYKDSLKEILDLKTSCIVEIIISDKSTCFPEPTYRSTVDKQSPVLSDAEIMRIEEEIYGR